MKSLGLLYIMMLIIILSERYYRNVKEKYSSQILQNILPEHENIVMSTIYSKYSFNVVERFYALWSINSSLYIKRNWVTYLWYWRNVRFNLNSQLIIMTNTIVIPLPRENLSLVEISQEPKARKFSYAARKRRIFTAWNEDNDRVERLFQYFKYLQHFYLLIFFPQKKYTLNPSPLLVKRPGNLFRKLFATIFHNWISFFKYSGVTLDTSLLIFTCSLFFFPIDVAARS